MAEIEVAEVDFNKFRRASPPAAAGGEPGDPTQGDLDRSLWQPELRQPEALGDELRAALVADSGMWGGITLLRETGPAFTPTEAGFLASLSSHLADGLHRALLLTALSAHPDDAEAGQLVLAFDKAGVRARGELVARLLFEHYTPRLADGSPVAPTGWFAPTPAADAQTGAG